MNRVYVFNCSMDHPGAEVGLYYPDVFTGSINCTEHRWFHGLPNSRQKDFPWVFVNLPKTDAAITALGKTRRFVLIDRSENGSGVTQMDDDIATFGYIKDGYKDTKILSARTNIAQKVHGLSAGLVRRGTGIYRQRRQDALDTADSGGRRSCRRFRATAFAQVQAGPTGGSGGSQCKASRPGHETSP